MFGSIDGMRNCRQGIAVVLAATLIGGCATKPAESSYVVAQPQQAPIQTVTNFTESLRCMDDMFLRRSYNHEIPISSAGIPDQTGKITAGTRDMLISAISAIVEPVQGVPLYRFRSRPCGTVRQARRARHEPRPVRARRRQRARPGHRRGKQQRRNQRCARRRPGPEQAAARLAHDRGHESRRRLQPDDPAGHQRQQHAGHRAPFEGRGSRRPHQFRRHPLRNQHDRAGRLACGPCARSSN